MVHCKEYTEIAVAEKSNLGIWKKLGVFFHWCICRACQKFKKQSKKIDQDIHSVIESQVFELDDTTKNTLKQAIEAQIKSRT